MTTKNDGGPAFPVETVCLHGSYGMTMRDYFAAKAMNGMAAGSSYECTDKDLLLLAKQAYQMADAMLKAREDE